MATTQIRGTTQIKDLTITNSEIASNAAIETSKLAEGSEFLKKDGSVTMTADLDFGTYKPKNVGDPTTGSDGVTLTYANTTYLKPTTTRTELTSEPPNGVRLNFTISETPTGSSELVYLNGMLQQVGASFDYTLSSDTLSFNIAPASADRIRVIYRYSNEIYDDIIYNPSP